VSPQSPETTSALLPREVWAYFFLIAGLTLVCQCASAQAARYIAQKALPSVVLLIMADTNGQPLSLGSGFFVGDGIIATNLHVIIGAAQGRAKLFGQPQAYSISGLVGIDEPHDLALLQIDGVTRSPLPLADSRALSVGDEVYVVGNPAGLEGTLSTGIISGVRNIDSYKILQITAPISPGSSGGPVLNQHGNVVGVAVATFKGGQNLNFAVPSSYLTNLLSQMTPMFPLTSRSTTTPAIINALGGRLTEAIQITHRELTCDHIPKLSFSIRNTLPRPVSNISLLFIYKDLSGLPFDFQETTYWYTIPPGLAKRERQEWIPAQMAKQRIGKRWVQCVYSYDRPTFTSDSDLGFIEIRVLGFRMVDE